MTYKRGEVVLAAFPYSDSLIVKPRPALIIQDESVITGSSDKLLIPITSKVAKTSVTRIFVKMDSPDGREMGILHDSMIVADKIRSLDANAIYKKVGYCPSMKKVDSALRLVLGL